MQYNIDIIGYGNMANYHIRVIPTPAEIKFTKAYDISKETVKLFGALGQSHDARYDTATLYLCFNAGADKYPTLNEKRNKYISSQDEGESL